MRERNKRRFLLPSDITTLTSLLRISSPYLYDVSAYLYVTILFPPALKERAQPVEEWPLMSSHHHRRKKRNSAPKYEQYCLRCKKQASSGSRRFRNLSKSSSSSSTLAKISTNSGRFGGSESIAMETAARKSGGGFSESFYRLIMRRNSIYVTFIIAGAFFGERAVDYGVKKLWERNNVGKRYEDISVLGQRPSEE
ncbi:hypothetical protein SAY87_008050 [Trapa incisa]|uniref:Complex III subunit 9 n=1 Tax=Trapa incisa TaxID=236973 RepID=A0AAN7KCL2_9MYRT|nr:hypothetical protein SAY87_008050 [Trapa incisa]